MRAWCRANMLKTGKLCRLYCCCCWRLHLTVAGFSRRRLRWSRLHETVALFRQRLFMSSCVKRVSPADVCCVLNLTLNESNIDRSQTLLVAGGPTTKLTVCITLNV